jgi:hypothetical protein
MSINRYLIALKEFMSHILKLRKQTWFFRALNHHIKSLQ